MSRVEVPSDVQDPIHYVLREYGGPIGAAAMNLSDVVYKQTSLSLREMEAARLRTAHINGCLVCKSARASRDFDTHSPVDATALERPMSSRGEPTDDEFYDQIGSWRTASAYSPRERLAIEYAERLGQDPQGMHGDEDFWQRMHAKFSDREIVDLSFSIACWMGVGRVVHALELDNVCLAAPEAQLV